VHARTAGKALTVSDYVLDLLPHDLSLSSRRRWLVREERWPPVDVDAVTRLDGERNDEMRQTES
jgi:hypothetical protein